jgi:hypothetical protein
VRAGVREHAVSIQFRFEVYNLFNTPQFGAPNGSVAIRSGKPVQHIGIEHLAKTLAAEGQILHQRDAQPLPPN